MSAIDAIREQVTRLQNEVANLNASADRIVAAVVDARAAAPNPADVESLKNDLTSIANSIAETTTKIGANLQ